MTKKASVGAGQPSAVAAPTVRDARTGRVLPLKGYGALKGQYAVRRGIDLTKPISEQAARLERAGEPDRTAGEQGAAAER